MPSGYQSAKCKSLRALFAEGFSLIDSGKSAGAINCVAVESGAREMSGESISCPNELKRVSSRYFRRLSIRTISSYATIFSAMIAAILFGLTAYSTSRILENIESQQARYFQEAFSRSQGSFSLAWKTIGEANDQRYELGQSKALLYLAENNELPGYVTLHNSSISLFTGSNTFATNVSMIQFNLVHSSFCGTRISSFFEKTRPFIYNFSYSSFGNGAELTGHFPKADFLAADLSDATMSAMEAENARFAAATLVNVTFKGGRFKGADFQGADLRGLKTERGSVGVGAYTYGAGTEWADLMFSPSWPKLFGSDIGVVDTLKAVGIYEMDNDSLRYVVDFSEANFAYADIRGADLRNSNIIQAQVNGACGDQTTQLPLGGIVDPNNSSCNFAATVTESLSRLRNRRALHRLQQGNCDVNKDKSMGGSKRGS